MSIESSLERLRLDTLDGVTPESLKRSFKAAALHAHPDKGGEEGDFDALLSAYLTLSRLLKRQTGGRDGLAVLDVDQIRQAREDQYTQELNQLLNEMLDSYSGETSDREAQEAFRTQFHAEFEKVHVRDERGHGDWLKEEIKEVEEMKEMDLSPSSWNAVFEASVRRTPVPTALILHPEQMARSYGPHGAQLIPVGDSFTSEVDECPMYTDVYEAYATQPTLLQHVPVYHERVRTLDDLLKERETVQECQPDEEREALAAYERQKQEQERAHTAQLRTYFQSTGSSQWALRSSDSFVKEFKH